MAGKEGHILSKHFSGRWGWFCLFGLAFAATGIFQPAQAAPTGSVTTLLTTSLTATIAGPNSITLSWNVFGTTSCTASAKPVDNEWAGAKSASMPAATFTQTLTAPTEPTTFFLQCIDRDGHTGSASTQSPIIPAPITHSSEPPLVLSVTPVAPLATQVPPQPQPVSPAESFLAGTALATAGLSLASLGAFGLSTTAGGVGLGAFLLNILTLLAVAGNALLEALRLRTKRYPWGTVFNIDGDLPLELAIVRLKTAGGRLVETRVTDQAGRVGFLPLPGAYQLEILKTHYAVAPLRSAANSRYRPVSDGKSLQIPNASTAIQTNIPMELIGRGTAGATNILQIIHLPLLILTVVLASTATYFAPTLPNFILLSLPLLLLMGEWLVVHPSSFGVVRGAQNQLLNGIALQLIDSQSHKVLATQVTDLYGRYSFLARPGIYHLRIANSGGADLPPWLAQKKFRIIKTTGGLIAPSFTVTEPAHKS